MTAGGLWLIYALGGGWGHLTRAAALARAAQARHRVRILTNSPYTTRVASAMPELDLIVLEPSLTVQATRHRAIQQIAAADPDCLIVDTFPRGLGGELAAVMGSLAETKVLVHRDLTPRYAAEAGLREFVRCSYDLVLIPGEDEAGAFADNPSAAITKPWLIRDPPPTLERRVTRTILVCASGNKDELPWYGAAAASLRALNPAVKVRCVAPTCPPGCPRECWIEHWPAIDLYPSADVVIGSAGYNTIHECAACQVPLVARPWPRKYDRQWLRAKRAAERGLVLVVKEPDQAALAALNELTRQPRPRADEQIRNGAHDAVTLIETRSEKPATRN